MRDRLIRDQVPLPPFSPFPRGRERDGACVSQETLRRLVYGFSGGLVNGVYGGKKEIKWFFVSFF